jgi:L-fuculose-phosphate aldolase
MPGVPPVLPLLRERATHRALRRAGAELQAAGLVRAQSGNLSVRAGAGMQITTAGARLGTLRRPDLTWVDLDGRPAPRRRSTPSSETALHAAIYRARPDVGAVVHTHGAFSTAWAGATSSLELVLEEARYYAMGTSVPVVPWRPAGSPELATAASAVLGDGVAVLLADHGALAVGPDLRRALDVAASLEHQAHVAWLLAAGRHRADGAQADDGLVGELAWPTR